MGHFEFDQQRTHGTNRAATADCENCGGHRLVRVVMADERGHETYGRCPSCSPAPVTERQPVDQARWKNYDR
jgi:DNA-directed RNA polymerase subunit RPC12/RpoP